MKQIKPFKVKKDWFYFRDGKDGNDYHNFSYMGHYLDTKQIYRFTVAYPTGPEGEEEQLAAEAFLKRNKIPYSTEYDQIVFEAKYVNLSGYKNWKGVPYDNNAPQQKAKYTFKLREGKKNNIKNMKKSELKKLIKEEIKVIKNNMKRKLNELNYQRYLAHCIRGAYLKSLGISESDITVIAKMYAKIATKIGDQGSCVMGNGIKINGKIAIHSYSQGSFGLEEIQAEVIPYLQKKYPKLKISYDWGNMDEHVDLRKAIRKIIKEEISVLKKKR